MLQSCNQSKLVFLCFTHRVISTPGDLRSQLCCERLIRYPLPEMAETVVSMARSMVRGAISVAASAAAAEVGLLVGVRKDTH